MYPTDKKEGSNVCQSRLRQNLAIELEEDAQNAVVLSTPCQPYSKVSKSKVSILSSSRFLGKVGQCPTFASGFLDAAKKSTFRNESSHCGHIKTRLEHPRARALQGVRECYEAGRMKHDKT